MTDDPVRAFPGNQFVERAGQHSPVAIAACAAFALSGCLGVFANDGSSLSFGTHAKGALVHGVAMPFAGAGYQVHPDWRGREHQYATQEVARWLTSAFARVEYTLPGSVAYLGDISARGGGGAAMHRSHASGRDIDIFYFAVDANGEPLRDLPAMIHFDAEGRARTWSAGAGHVPKPPVPDATFDARRNWALVRALLEDPNAEVQWIFARRELAALMIAQAEREAAPAALVNRARALLHQPTDSQPHDDHMHVRVFCDPRDRGLGCVDKGPKRWLKKHWKYMPSADSANLSRS